MNWLDFTLISIIAIGTIFGVLTGPLWQTYRIFSVILAGIIAYLLNDILSNILNGIFTPGLSTLLGYIIVFFTVLIITYVLGNLFKLFLTRGKFGMVGRIIGGGLGFTKTVLTCCAFIMAVSYIGNDKANKVIQDSIIARKLYEGTELAISNISKGLKGNQDTWEKNKQKIDKIIHERI